MTHQNCRAGSIKFASFLAYVVMRAQEALSCAMLSQVPQRVELAFGGPQARARHGKEAVWVWRGGAIPP